MISELSQTDKETRVRGRTTALRHWNQVRTTELSARTAPELEAV